MFEILKYKTIDKIPYSVKFKDIKEFDRFEERFTDIEQYFGDIVGMNVDYVEFCPNHSPPLKDEILPWLWIIHPELKDKILKEADEKLKTIIKEYDEYNL